MILNWIPIFFFFSNLPLFDKILKDSHFALYISLLSVYFFFYGSHFTQQSISRYSLLKKQRYEYILNFQKEIVKRPSSPTAPSPFQSITTPFTQMKRHNTHAACTHARTRANMHTVPAPRAP